ncbi:MAG: zinc ribbon domain-containing protein [Candidatus Dormibacteraeota bacterium]|nr:zinc ribbon domain-containing protein [Candidatus Dormibacteraeota bacterium]
MPIYEYHCADCDHSFEVLTSFAERDRAKVCPSCESRRTSVQVSSFAAVGAGEFTSTLPMAPSGGGCACGGSCGCGSPN